jgi:hypothetical protein
MPDIRNILSAQEAERRIRGIVKFGYVTPLPHCRLRMKERGYDDTDLELILSTGRIIEPPEFNTEYNNWVCIVEGNVVEGDIAVVVTAIFSHNELHCITIKPK